MFRSLKSVLRKTNQKGGFHNPLLSNFNMGNGAMRRNKSSDALWRAKVNFQVPDTTLDDHVY